MPHERAAFFSPLHRPSSDAAPARARATLVGAWLMYFSSLTGTDGGARLVEDGADPAEPDGRLPVVSRPELVHADAGYPGSCCCRTACATSGRARSSRRSTVAASWCRRRLDDEARRGLRRLFSRGARARAALLHPRLRAPPSPRCAGASRAVAAAAAAVHRSLAAPSSASPSPRRRARTAPSRGCGRWVHAGQGAPISTAAATATTAAGRARAHDASKTDCVGCGAASTTPPGRTARRRTSSCWCSARASRRCDAVAARRALSAHGAHGLDAYMLQVAASTSTCAFKRGRAPPRVALLKLEGAMLPVTLALSRRRLRPHLGARAQGDVLRRWIRRRQTASSASRATPSASPCPLGDRVRPTRCERGRRARVSNGARVRLRALTVTALYPTCEVMWCLPAVRAAPLEVS